MEHSLFVSISLFIVGLLLIIKGGDIFVDAATWAADVSGIPKFIIGATVVSLATTLPELLVSLFASFEGKVDMAIGNAVGSVTANTAMIMAISIICLPAFAPRKDVGIKSILLLASTALLLILSFNGELSIVESLLLLFVFTSVIGYYYEAETSFLFMFQGEGKEKIRKYFQIGMKLVMIALVVFYGVVESSIA